MPKCNHPHVTIQIEFAMRSENASVILEGTAPYAQLRSPTHGPARNEGYWSRAHLFVRCHDCGKDFLGYTSADWRQFPKWLAAHWQNLVAQGGLVAEISKHHHMFEEGYRVL